MSRSLFYPREFKLAGGDFAETEHGLCELVYPELWDASCVLATLGPQPPSLTARDHSGRNNHGTLTGGPTWTKSQYRGQGFGPVEFDGADDYVDLGRVPEMFNGLNTKMTLAAWIEADDPTKTWTNAACWIGVPSQATGNQFQAIFGDAGGPDNNIYMLYNTGAWPLNYKYILSTATTIVAHELYHVAMYLDLGNLGASKICVNGNVVVSSSGSVGTCNAFADLGQSLELGEFDRLDPTTAARSWHDGRLSDVRMYTREPSPPQIATLARSPYEPYRCHQRRVWFTPGATPPAGTYWLWARQHQAQIIGGGL